jgi:hypothetical protein
MWEIEIQAGNNTKTCAEIRYYQWEQRVRTKYCFISHSKVICMVLTFVLGWLIAHCFDEDHHF